MEKCKQIYLGKFWGGRTEQWREASRYNTKTCYKAKISKTL